MNFCYNKSFRIELFYCFVHWKAGIIFANHELRINENKKKREERNEGEMDCLNEKKKIF